MEEENQIEISPKYADLFRIPIARLVLEGKSNELTHVEASRLGKIDIVIITGGRFSSKSYVGSLANAVWMKDYNYRILFTRYTLISAEDTIIPDFMEKLDILGARGSFRVRKDRVSSRVNKSKVVFKGLKTSAGNQTASLKSLKDFNVFMLDEGEEMESYEDWRKIYLSMRASDVQNLSIIMMNPSDINHFVYEEFFNKRGVEEGFNGIVGNVLYIHTTYLDVNPKFIPRNILEEFERMKEEDPEEYAHVALGKWRQNTEGTLFKKDEVQYFALGDLREEDIAKATKLSFIDVADEGTDSLSMPIGYVIGKDVYITDWYFTTDNTDLTIPTCAEFCRMHNIDFVAVETNGMGSIFAKELLKVLPKTTTMMFVNQKAGKHSRILSTSGRIKYNFWFRNDVAFGTMYDIAMRELFAYNKDRSLNGHDDAPDSLAGLSLFCDDLTYN